MDIDKGFLWFCGGFGVFLLLAMLLGAWIQSRREAFEREAIAHGVAHYVFDDAGDPHFEWRKP